MHLLNAFSCFVIFRFRVGDDCMEEPAAADCWEKIKGVCLFIKVVNLHHLAFPNGGCKQAMTLTRIH